MRGLIWLILGLITIAIFFLIFPFTLPAAILVRAVLLVDRILT